MLHWVGHRCQNTLLHLQLGQHQSPPPHVQKCLSRPSPSFPAHETKWSQGPFAFCKWPFSSKTFCHGIVLKTMLISWKQKHFIFPLQLIYSGTGSPALYQDLVLLNIGLCSTSSLIISQLLSYLMYMKNVQSCFSTCCFQRKIMCDIHFSLKSWHHRCGHNGIVLHLRGKVQC